MYSGFHREPVRRSWNWWNVISPANSHQNSSKTQLNRSLAGAPVVSLLWGWSVRVWGSGPWYRRAGSKSVQQKALYLSKKETLNWGESTQAHRQTGSRTGTRGTNRSQDQQELRQSREEEEGRWGLNKPRNRWDASANNQSKYNTPQQGKDRLLV